MLLGRLSAPVKHARETICPTIFMENKHKAAGKESMVIKNQKKNAVQIKQKNPKAAPAGSKSKKSK